MHYKNCLDWCTIRPNEDNKIKYKDSFFLNKHIYLSDMLCVLVTIQVI